MDIIVYGETCTHSSLGLSINRYVSYVHKAKLHVVGNYRRGLAIFYLKKHCFLLQKVYSSDNYDIVWIRFSTYNEPVYFCVFYSPGCHHPLSGWGCQLSFAIYFCGIACFLLFSILLYNIFDVLLDFKS